MRIPDYNIPIKVKDLSPKKRRIDKIREEEFGEELEEALPQEESEPKKKSIVPPRLIGYPWV